MVISSSHITIYLTMNNLLHVSSMSEKDPLLASSAFQKSKVWKILLGGAQFLFSGQKANKLDQIDLIYPDKKGSSLDIPSSTFLTKSSSTSTSASSNESDRWYYVVASSIASIELSREGLSKRTPSSESFVTVGDVNTAYYNNQFAPGYILLHDMILELFMIEVKALLPNYHQPTIPTQSMIGTTAPHFLICISSLKFIKSL